MKREQKIYAAGKVSKKRKTSDLLIHEATEENKRGKNLRGKKKKAGKRFKTDVKSGTPMDRTSCESHVANEAMANQSKNPRKKKRKSVEGIKTIDLFNEDKNTYQEHDVVTLHSKRNRRKRQSLVNELSKNNLPETITEVVEEEVYRMSSGDEDSSKGMKKWIVTYHQSRPGIKVLQERIDDYIASHEAQEEQARKEREAQVAEGGWEVVKHHKGGKKTTNTESGVAVGSVSQTAVMDKMIKKKKKEVTLDFYRFQRREAHKTEILMLQSKFEQDKKRIQQMRAERKFRPY